MQTSTVSLCVCADCSRKWGTPCIKLGWPIMYQFTSQMLCLENLLH